MKIFKIQQAKNTKLFSFNTLLKFQEMEKLCLIFGKLKNTDNNNVCLVFVLFLNYKK